MMQTRVYRAGLDKQAGDIEDKYAEDVKSMDNIINAVYSTIPEIKV